MNKPQRLSNIKIHLILFVHAFYSCKRNFKLFFTSLFLLTAVETSKAQDFSGLLRNYNAVVTTGDNEYLVGRNRFIFDVGIDASFGSIFISNEILNTYTISSNDYAYDFAEAYIDLFFETSDLRIGKQIISQGRTEANFITDILSPIDISEFLTLQLDDLRAGIPAIKYTKYYGSNFLELVTTPIFQSNIQAQPGSRWFPFTEIEKQTNVLYTDSLQENTFNSFQGMIKWGFRENIKWDLDIMAILWTPGNPSYQKELALIPGIPPQTALQLTKSYLRSPILAYSGNFIASDNLIFKSESAYYFKKHADYLPELFVNADLNNLTPLEQQAIVIAFDDNEDGFLKEKPWLSSMIGVQTSFGDVSISTEFIFERIFDYEADILQEENFYFSTLSLQKSMMRNKLNLRVFGRYNYIGSDYWINPEATYDLKDGLVASLGFHLFGGDESEAFYGHFNFKNYAASSFGFVTLTAFSKILRNVISITLVKFPSSRTIIFRLINAKFADFVTNNPRVVSLFIFVLVILAIFPASEIRTDFDLENFYPKEDPTVQSYRLLEEEFGRDDNIIMVGYKEPDLFSYDKLIELKSIIDEVSAIENVTDVQSIWSAEEIVNKDGTLTFDPFLETDSLRGSTETIKNSITSDTFSEGFLINSEGNTTAFYIEIDETNNTYETRNIIINELNRVLEKHSNTDFKITGIPYFRNQYVNMLNGEVVFYILFSSVLIILLLWYLYRSISGVLIPMLIVWFTVLFTVAAITLTGGYLEIMSSTIAPILLCVGVADSVHMISKFDDAVQHGMKQRKAIAEMILTLGSATLLTSLTTAIGFGTLITSSVVPMKRFGLYTALGVLIAYTITMLFLPSILKITKIDRVFKENGGRIYSWIAEKLALLSKFNKKFHKQISITALTACILIGGGMYGLQVNGRVFDDVSRDSILIKDSNFFSENLAPAFPLEFVIDTKEENGITDPDFVRRVDELQQHLLTYPEIKRATSFSTLMKELHTVMSPNEARISALPDNQNLISQYLLLLEVTDNDILERVSDFNYQKLRLASQTEDAGSKRINEIRTSVEEYIDSNFTEEEITITGSTILSANLVGKMVYSLASSIGLAFICISILMAFLFRDLKMVIISLIPNIMPLVLIAGFMGILGVDIKPSTAVIFTIAFGIAVDDTIHYLARFRIELRRGLGFQEALEITTQKTGRAIIITSMILLIGFGTLISSEFTSTTLMGMLVSSTIFFAIVADLIVLPALFYWLKPKLKEIRRASTPE